MTYLLNLLKFDCYSQAYGSYRHIDDNYDHDQYYCDNHNDDHDDHDLSSAKTCRDFLSTLLAGSVLDSLSESARVVTRYSFVIRLMTVTL